MTSFLIALIVFVAVILALASGVGILLALMVHNLWVATISGVILAICFAVLRFIYLTYLT